MRLADKRLWSGFALRFVDVPVRECVAAGALSKVKCACTPTRALGQSCVIVRVFVTTAHTHAARTTTLATNIISSCCGGRGRMHASTKREYCVLYYCSNQPSERARARLHTWSKWCHKRKTNGQSSRRLRFTHARTPCATYLSAQYLGDAIARFFRACLFVRCCCIVACECCNTFSACTHAADYSHTRAHSHTRAVH